MRARSRDALVPSSVQWIGDLPESWRLERLGLHFTQRNEVTSDDTVPALSVTKEGVLPQKEHVAKAAAGAQRKIVREGDFVINSRSDRKGAAGIAPIAGAVSTISIVLQPRGLDSRYVHHLLRSTAFQEEFYRFGSGIVADLWTTRFAAMSSITLPIPPADEQQAIADFLDRETAEIDAFIADQKRLIELLTERRHAEEARLIFGLNISGPKVDTGQPWVPQVPQTWGMARVGDHYAVQLGKMLDSGKRSTDRAQVLPYIRAANIQERSLNLADVNMMPFEPEEIVRFDLKENDLLIVEGGSVGMNVTLKRDMDAWAFQKTVNRVRSRGEGEPRFLGLVLDAYRRAGVFEVIAGKSTIQHLTAEKLRGLRVPAPSIAEQRRIAAAAHDIGAEVDAAIADAREAIALSKERRAALISAAVTGKIDVANR